MPRASLGAEFSKDLVVLSACGSLRHDAIHSWVLSNWNVFVRGLVEVLLEMLESDELTLQPAREARARRAFRVTIELAGAVRKYMALDALKSSNGVHALLAVCDNDSGSGSLLQSGYYWEHETQISLMSDKQRLKLKASAYAPMCYAHVIFMEEVAAAIERAPSRGSTTSTRGKRRSGSFASGTLWRQFARRCRVYRCKNRQMLKAKIAMRISPLEATNALLKRIEGACDVVRASARYKARQEIKRKLEAAETTDATSRAATTPRPGRPASRDERATKSRRRARARPTRTPRRIRIRRKRIGSRTSSTRRFPSRERASRRCAGMARARPFRARPSTSVSNW